MAQWTWGQIRTKVEQDLDLLEEQFISPSELLGYGNEAIGHCEAEIHTLYEDYYLTNAPIALVSGQAAYSLPSDIYAQKIRGLEYTNGTLTYPITRIKDWMKFRRFSAGNMIVSSNPSYQYLITNATGGLPTLQLCPPAQETSSNVTLWYLRRAARLTLDTDLCDIPQDFVSYVLQYMKVRCYEKEGHPNLAMAVQALEFERKNMVETLTQMCPDGDDGIEHDYSFYEELS